MLDPGLCGGVAGVVHHLLDLARLAPLGHAIDAAIGAVRKNPLSASRSLASSACTFERVSSSQFGSWSTSNSARKPETCPGAVTGEDLVDLRLEVVPAQLG